MFILFVIIGFAVVYGIFSVVAGLIGSTLRPDIVPDKTKPTQVIVRKRVVTVITPEFDATEPVVRLPRPAIAMENA
jgi:hypothetical protein